MNSESNTIAWMAHPLSGDIPGNIAKAKRWMKWLIRTFQIDFAADWILWCEILDDNDAEERGRGIAFDKAMISRLDSYWMVGGRISFGMAMELEAAKAHNKTIIDLTGLGSEPPASEGYKNLTSEQQRMILDAMSESKIFSESALEALRILRP